MTRETKNLKSAEEIEAGIQWVATYKKQHLNDELVNATPETIFTPAAPCKPSELGESSEHGEGGDTNDKMLYKLHPQSTPHTFITEAEVEALPSPMVSISLERENIEGKKATVRFRE